MVEVLNLSLDDFGIKLPQETNKEKEQLLKIILSADDSEVKAYLDIILNFKRVVKTKP